MLHGVKINFSNGALGSVLPSADCVVGLIATGVAVTNKFALAKAYVLSSLSGLDGLGITSDGDDANAFIYKVVKEFYAEAGNGAELWLYGVPNTVKASDMLDKTKTHAKNFIEQANGRLRILAAAFKPASGYSAVTTSGMDADVMLAAANGQALAEWATETLFAPVVVLIEGRCYTSTNITALQDLNEKNYNRVGILIGDTVSDSDQACIGIFAGRVAASPVQRHIGRVKDGALSPFAVYIEDKSPAEANVETLFNKGYITFRTFVGKSGYFFTDDSLATAATDDYRSLARRRTIDKAYRIIYNTMLENVNDEIACTADGKIVPAVAKAIEGEVITAIVNNMTAAGELGVDPTNSNDKGVKCVVDQDSNVMATSKVNVTCQVRPYGYAKYIDVELGFETE